MKIKYVLIIILTFLVVISGCVSTPPTKTQEELQANSTIQLLDDKIPQLKEQFYRIKQEIDIAETKKIDVSEVKIYIQGAEQKINYIEALLNNAKLLFSNKNFISANQTAKSARSSFDSLQANLNLAIDKFKEAFLKHAIQKTETTLLDLKNQSNNFEVEVSTANSEGVDTTNVSKYIQLNEQYISIVDTNLNSAKSELNNKNYNSISIKINDTIIEFQKIQDNLNQGIKSLQDEYNKTIALSQELLTQADIEIRKAEIHLTDAQNSGADITKFQSKYEQVKATSDQAHEALSSRQFKAVKPKTDFAINIAKEIESEALDAKYDALSKKSIQGLTEQIQGNEALHYLEKANESRLNKKYEESVVFANKAVAATSIFIIESEISSLEKFSIANFVILNLNNIKNSENEARAELDRNNMQGSLQIAKQTNNLLKDSLDSVNNYMAAKFEIEKARKTSLLWISANTSQADEYLNKSMEQIKLSNFEEAIKLSKQATDSANKVEMETRKKIDDNLILRLIKLIKDVASSEQAATKPEYVQYKDITNLTLVNVKFTPPEINIDFKSLRQTAPSIPFQNVSVISPQAPSKAPDIEKIKVFSARIEEIDYGGLKLGKTSYARILISNDGTETITSERVEITAGKSFPLVGYKEQSETFEYKYPIEPSNNRWLTQGFNIPATYSGFSLTGAYDITITVYANNKYVDVWKGNLYLTT